MTMMGEGSRVPLCSVGAELHEAELHEAELEVNAQSG